MTVDGFIRKLKSKPSEDMFNPWFERDAEHDELKSAPDIRKRQLKAYLNERIGRARFLFIAEALGYQGGHFTGMAMTSERLLLNHLKHKKLRPKDVFTTIEPKRTTKKTVNQKGMTEPTCTIVWGALKELGIDTYDVVTWNAVPWHPYDEKKGLLSNRTPRADELAAGLELLPSFKSLFPDAHIVAIGRKCEGLMEELGWEYTGVRHPANGGAPKFRKQIKELFDSSQT